MKLVSKRNRNNSTKPIKRSFKGQLKAHLFCMVLVPYILNFVNYLNPAQCTSFEQDLDTAQGFAAPGQTFVLRPPWTRITTTVIITDTSHHVVMASKVTLLSTLGLSNAFVAEHVDTAPQTAIANAVLVAKVTSV